MSLFLKSIISLKFPFVFRWGAFFSCIYRAKVTSWHSSCFIWPSQCFVKKIEPAFKIREISCKKQDFKLLLKNRRLRHCVGIVTGPARRLWCADARSVVCRAAPALRCLPRCRPLKLVAFGGNGHCFKVVLVYKFPLLVMFSSNDSHYVMLCIQRRMYREARAWDLSKVLRDLAIFFLSLRESSPIV